MQQWISIALAVLGNILYLAWREGRTAQRLENIEKNMDKQEALHNAHFKFERDHEAKDQAHVNDNDAHWNRREREWLNQRFLEVGERFDKLEAMILNIISKKDID